jgi:hypothetical protein
MPSSTRQKALNIRAYVIEQLGEDWTDPSPEEDQSSIEELTDEECAIFNQQEAEKVRKPKRAIPAI